MTQASLRKLERKTALHQLVLGKQLQMMKFVCQQPPDPHSAHQVKGTQPYLPFNYPVSCLGLWAGPSPLGRWLSLEVAQQHSF